MRNKYRNQITIIAITILVLFFTVNAEAELQVRSIFLHKRTVQEGNTQRIDYVDNEGNITFAVDKCYATKITTNDEKTKLEEFFDEKGNPSKQQMGYHAIYSEFDKLGRIWRLTFLDENKQPKLTNNGYAVIERTFYENNNIKTEYYFDEKGEPINTKAYGYGCYKEYDDNNRNNITAYMGSDGTPIMTGQGYAIVHRSFYEDGPSKGRVEEEYYYDAGNKPVMLAHGQFGAHKSYDSFGRIMELTYLDEMGNPIITTEGYTTIKRAYYEDDSIKSEMYYDIAGKQISLSEGQYGVLYKDGKIEYLDKNGHQQINIKRILYNNGWLVVLAAVTLIVVSVLFDRKVNGILFVFYLLAIIYMTIMWRSTVNKEYYSFLQATNMEFSINSFFTKGTIDNILLFIPLGTIAFRIFPQKRILFITFAISIIIELLQYALRIGLCDLHDVISNCIGSVLGYYIGQELRKAITIIKKTL